MSQRTQHLSPRGNRIASQQGLRYTCGIPHPAGSAGLGAHAWRKVEMLRKPTTRESRSPQLT
jgi:hypothetical protein